MNKPAPLNKKNEFITDKYIRIFLKNLNASSENNKGDELYFYFIDRLCRSLNFTKVDSSKKLAIDLRGKKFIFLDTEQGFEILFFGWLYYFPWYHLFPYGELGDKLENKCDEIKSFIKDLPPDEALDIDKISIELLKSLSISWTIEDKISHDDVENLPYAEDVIKEKILCWGVRHMLFQPLSWFEFLGFHDINMDISDVQNSKYVVISPKCNKFLSSKKGLVI
jgi:hypothetical protein